MLDVVIMRIVTMVVWAFIVVIFFNASHASPLRTAVAYHLIRDYLRIDLWMVNMLITELWPNQTVKNFEGYRVEKVA